jgi:signal transduction histidine kinase
VKLNLKISNIGTLLVSVPLAFQLLFLSTLGFLLHQSDAEVQRAQRSKTIVAQANTLMVQIMRKLGCLQQSRNGSTSPTEAQHWRTESEDADKLIKANIADLENLLASNQRQIELLRDAEKLFAASTSLIERLSEPEFMDLRLEGRMQSYSANKQLNNCFYRMLADINSIVAEEKKVELQSPELQKRNTQFIELVLVLSVVFNIFLALLLAKYFGSFITRRLQVLTDNTRRIMEGGTLKPPLKGDDEISQVDQVFHQMADKLKEVERMKKEFVAMVSHDLRTPLTSIQALLTLLETGVLVELPDKARNRIEGGQSEITRLISLVNELLDIERMEGGKLDLEFNLAPLSKIIARSVQSVNSLSESRRIGISYPETDEQLYVDEDRIVQVIVNILSNAIKFSPDDSRISITMSGDKDKVLIKITDQGRGIPLEHRASIFNRFQQVELGDNRRGTGLGLAICKTIIEQHGGTIGVESAMGRGSTFWFTLPRNPAGGVLPRRKEARRH